MKKVFSLILCIAICALVLVSCDEPTHVHQYNRDEWKIDDTSHWYANTCECEDAGVKNKAAHVYSINNGICDVCGYVDCDHPEFESTYSSDENAHWYAPKCGHSVKKDHEPHVDSDKNGACDKCGYTA